MKNSIKLVLTLFLFSFVLFGQNKIPNFDSVDFSKKAELAEWLVRYDNVAWKTSDVLVTQDKKNLERLGKEWFCFQDKSNVWHAVYGKYASDKFETVFHYVIDRQQKISLTKEIVDQEFLNSHAKALVTARSESVVAMKGANAPLFNQYIRQNSDKTFDVWIFPAFQRDGTTVFGGEFIYKTDQTGTKIIKDESYFQGNFRGFKTGNPREIWLNYRELEKPTLGTVFFVWYYKDYFTRIFIDNKNFTTTAVGSANQEYIWVHVEKENETKAKEK